MKSISLVLLLTASLLSAQNGAGPLVPPSAPADGTYRTLSELWDEIQALKTQTTTQQSIILDQQTTLGLIQTSITTHQQTIAQLQQQNTQLLTINSDGIPWVTELAATLPTDSLSSPSLAFGPDGHPAIAYQTETELHLTRYNGSVWIDEIVDTESNSILNSTVSLAFTHTGHPAISYHHRSNDTLRYAEYDGTSWILQEVWDEDNPGQFSSLAFTPTGQPAIAYTAEDTGKLKYQVRSGSSSWGDPMNIGNCSFSAAPPLAFSPSGTPTVIYNYPINGRNEINLGEFDGTQWVIDPHLGFFGDTAILNSNRSLSFSPDGHPQFVFHNHTQSIVELYHRKHGVSWERSTITPLAPNLGVNTSGYTIAYAPDSLARPHVFTIDSTINKLKHSSRISNWFTLNIQSATNDTRLAAATAPTGLPAVAVLDEDNGKLLLISKRLP